MFDKAGFVLKAHLPLAVRMAFILSILLLNGCTLLNKRWKGTTHVTLHDGTQATINERRSDPRYIDILPHSYGFTLGKDKKDIFEWKWNKTTYRKDTFFIPVILNIYEGTFYVVEFDRETDFSKSVYRFYSYHGEQWEEISYKDFPKPIAIQNLWLDQEDIELLKKMDPEEYWFRRSLTGRLWISLETGKPYYETENVDDFPISLFVGFKKMHITRRNTDPK